MITKLTLTIEKSVIRKAKRYANRTGRSLSKVVQSYLEKVTEPESNTTDIPDKIKKLIGSAYVPQSLDHKKEIRKIIQSKHK